MQQKLRTAFERNYLNGEPDGYSRHNPATILELLNVYAGDSDRLIETLPFSRHDTTAGSETELQAVVAGRREDVDLPVTIEQSNYFANINEAPRRKRTGYLLRSAVRFASSDNL